MTQFKHRRGVFSKGIYIVVIKHEKAIFAQ